MRLEEPEAKAFHLGKVTKIFPVAGMLFSTVKDISVLVVAPTVPFAAAMIPINFINPILTCGYHTWRRFHSESIGI